MSQKSFSGRAWSLTGPAMTLCAVVPSDTADLPDGPCRGLYVGTAGTLRLMDCAGHVVDLISSEAQYHPLRVQRVLATGTTAADVIALY